MARRRAKGLGAATLRIPTGTYVLFSAWIGLAIGGLVGSMILRKIREP